VKLSAKTFAEQVQSWFLVSTGTSPEATNDQYPWTNPIRAQQYKGKTVKIIFDDDRFSSLILGATDDLFGVIAHSMFDLPVGLSVQALSLQGLIRLPYHD